MKNLNKEQEKRVLVVGAGLAGPEAAWFLAQRGISVVLAEAKRLKLGPAQKSPDFAELVCTNSLKSLDPTSGHGLLKQEMTDLGSLILPCAKETAVPAGEALAVDREAFAALVTKNLASHPLITLIDREVGNPLDLAQEHQCQEIIVASGPLTTTPLEKWIRETLGAEDFYFYDAIAPVIDADSIDYSRLYFKDRHGEVSLNAQEAIEEDTDCPDYLNIPLTEEEYFKFIEELREAKKVSPKDFEEYKFFEACLPIDLMAERGIDTPRFSCMKPIGLEMPNGERPFACVQLRRENLLGSAYNMVGFQTRLTYPEQLRVFRTLPGLSEAQFFHLGSVHRNTFLNAKNLLHPALNSREIPRLSFAGQMTGVEGYTESAAIGLYVALQVYRRLQGQEEIVFPPETAIGALINYLMTVPKPTPSSINFGLFPKVELTREQRRDRKNIKKTKRKLISVRARAIWQKEISPQV